jgi:predicted PurR-regulated permease PerM
VRAAILPFVLAVVVAFILEPGVRFLEARGLPRLAAIILVYLAVAGVTAFSLFQLIPLLIEQLTLLAASLPAITAQVQTVLSEAQVRYLEAGLPDEVRQVVDRSIAEAEGALLAFIQSALTRLLDVFSGFLVLLLAPFLAFYLLKDKEAIREWVISVLPVAGRAETLRLLGEMNWVLSGFIRGQLVVAAIVGVLVGVATHLLGLRFSVILGVVAGVTNIIPYFGPIIGGLPAVLLALLRSPLLALKTALAIFLIQQLESLVISPRIVGGNVGLHPLVVIFSVLAGAQLYGFVGIIVAVPVVAVGKVFFGYILNKLVTDWSR